MSVRAPLSPAAMTLSMRQLEVTSEDSYQLEGVVSCDVKRRTRSPRPSEKARVSVLSARDYSDAATDAFPVRPLDSSNGRLLLAFILEQIDLDLAIGVLLWHLWGKEDLCVLGAFVVTIIPHQRNGLLDFGQVHLNILYHDDHPVIMIVKVCVVTGIGELSLKLGDVLFHLTDFV